MAYNAPPKKQSKTQKYRQGYYKVKNLDKYIGEKSAES